MDPKRMKGVVIAMTTPTSPEADVAFNQWMDDIHGPDLTETPGLYAWTRYENVDPAAKPRYLHVYELDRDDDGAAFDDLMAVAAKKRGEGRGMPEGIAEALHLGGHGLIFSLGEQPSLEVEGMQVMLAGIPDEHPGTTAGTTSTTPSSKHPASPTATASSTPSPCTPRPTTSTLPLRHQGLRRPQRRPQADDGLQGPLRRRQPGQGYRHHVFKRGPLDRGRRRRRLRRPDARPRRRDLFETLAV